MNLARSSSVPTDSLRPSAFEVAGRYLRGRRGLIALAIVALILGGALGWNWLVAIGIAPLLLGLLPCAAMCALGLCMHRMSRRSGLDQQTADKSPGPVASLSNSSRGGSADGMTSSLTGTLQK